MKARTLAAAAALSTLLSACASTHIEPYRPKRRTFDRGEYAARPAASGASLWSAGHGGLYADDRAHRVGDLIVVKIDESDQALRDDSTELDRSSKTEIGMPATGVLTALAAKYPSVDPAALLGTESEQTFAGSGKVQRKGRLVATLPVRVREVMPNGDLFVEGTKVVLIGREEQHLYLSGIVRASDISADNVVRSSRIAEAEIELVGRGDVTDQQRPGWFTRLVTRLNPF
jgi:flagellar L-ring protein precursor FlgH